MIKVQLWIRCVNYRQREEEIGNMSQEKLEGSLPLREGHFDEDIKGWLHRSQQSWENPPKERNPGVSSQRRLLGKIGGYHKLWISPNLKSCYWGIFALVSVSLYYEFLQVYCDLGYLNSFLWINVIPSLNPHWCSYIQFALSHHF